MTLYGMYPAAALDQIKREMGRVLDGVSHMNPLSPDSLFRTRAFPALNLWEDGECLYAEAEVSGMPMEDIGVHIAGNELIIKGERKPLEGEKQTFHRQERGTGEFSRTVTLPMEVNADKVEATLKDGVLTLTMPKAAAARARKITVKSE